jgi:hypothetical protein
MLGSTILLATLFAQFDIPPTVTPQEFQAWFDAADDGDLVVPDAVVQGARRFRYVFVGGFANEQMKGYFVQNTKDLHAMGVPRSSIHMIFPSSRETIEESAQSIREAFFTISSRGPERIVVIAHSRGACDALAFALTEPEFIRDHVEALFLVQGAFGGTALADYVVGNGPSMDNRMPARFRIIAGVVANLERGLIRRGHHAGLSGLTRAESQPFWARMLADHANAIPILAPRTFFIRSESRPSRLGRFRRAIGWYLNIYDGPNDGIVAVKDQYIPGLGTSLCILNCGHGDLTCNLTSGRSARRVRRALTQCVAMAVGRAGAEAAMAYPRQER